MEETCLYRQIDPRCIYVAHLSSWVQFCDIEHDGSCHGKRLPIFDRIAVARTLRLIDLKEKRICLADGTKTYVCLSYVGRPHSNQYALRRDNQHRLSEVNGLLSAMEDGTVPKTIMDAAYITNALACRYLWVDRLCIVRSKLLVEYHILTRI